MREDEEDDAGKRDGGRGRGRGERGSRKGSESGKIKAKSESEGKDGARGCERESVELDGVEETLDLEDASPRRLSSLSCARPSLPLCIQNTSILPGIFRVRGRNTRRMLLDHLWNQNVG